MKKELNLASLAHGKLIVLQQFIHLSFQQHFFSIYLMNKFDIQVLKHIITQQYILYINTILFNMSILWSLIQKIQNQTNRLLSRSIEKNQKITYLCQTAAKLKNQVLCDSIEEFKKIRDNTKEQLFLKTIKLENVIPVSKIKSRLQNLIFYKNIYKKIPIQIQNLNYFCGEPIKLKIRLFNFQGKQLSKRSFQIKNQVFINSGESESTIQIRIFQITSKVEKNFFTILIEIDQSSNCKEFISPLVLPEIIVRAKKIKKIDCNKQQSLSSPDISNSQLYYSESTVVRKGVINRSKKLKKNGMIGTRSGNLTKNRLELIC